MRARLPIGMMSLGLAALVALTTAGQAHAGPITVPGTPPWYEFVFGATGSFATNGSGSQPSSGGNSQQLDNPPWTFTSATPVAVLLTDAFNTGDQFTLFDNAVGLGTTPSVPLTNSGVSDPAVTSVSPAWSHMIFNLPPGSHSLTIQAANSPYGGGAAFFSVTPLAPTVVPEPSTLALLALGGGALAVWRRRKAKRAPA
jgi:hypothetical protein